MAHWVAVIVDLMRLQSASVIGMGKSTVEMGISAGMGSACRLLEPLSSAAAIIFFLIDLICYNPGENGDFAVVVLAANFENCFEAVFKWDWVCVIVSCMILDDELTIEM